MRLAWNNLLKTASSISATHEDANYPVENLYAKWKKQKFQIETGETISVVTIAWAADISVSCIGIAYHNLSAISAVLKDSGGSTLDTWTPPVTYQTDLYTDTAETTVRSIVITFTSATVAYLGSLFIGTYDEYYKEAGQALPFSSTDNITKSLGGQVAGRIGVSLRGAPISIPGVTVTQRKALETMRDSVRMLYPFWLDLWQSSHASFAPIYGHMTTDLDTPKDVDQFCTVSFGFEEAN